ncbi:MAG: hypothetical protein HUJ65_00785, partial [Oscillospiraceae bacterium]|nr:hypothetical protein [Oscillospiraceae bacterium]
YTAVFEKLDLIGAEYRVTETYDEDYPQLSPESDAESQTCTPLSLVMGEKGASGTIVNGTPGLVLLSKQWIAADEMSQLYLDDMNWSDSPSNTMVTATLEIDKGDGNGWVSAAGLPYYTLCTTNNTITGPSAISTNGTVTINFTNSAVLDLTGQTGWQSWKYRLTETKVGELNPSGTIVEWSDSNGQSHLTLFVPTGITGQVTGSAVQNPSATLKNELASKELFIIEKFWDKDSFTPDTGAELVFRVERFNGTAWEPASEVDYYLRYGRSDVTGESIGQTPGVTGADGLIRYAYDGSNEALGYTIGFTEEVHLNYPAGKAGDLRIVEVPELSDPSWGRLRDYTDETGAVTEDGPMGFLNSLDSDSIKVKKLMADGTAGKGPFTFELTQIIGESGTAIGGGIPYTVYNVGDDTPLETGITDENGRFTLLSGQYAILKIPAETHWKVTELTELPYELVDVQCDGDKATQDEDDPATGDIDLRPPTEQPMLVDGFTFNDTLFALLGDTEDSGNEVSTVTRITFGRKSDYPRFKDQPGTPMDVDGSGTIMLYVEG